MVKRLKEVTEKFYTNLQQLRNRYDLHLDSEEIDNSTNTGLKEASVEILDSLMARLKAASKNHNIPYGLLDEIDRPDVRLRLPWDKKTALLNLVYFNAAYDKAPSKYKEAFDIVTNPRMNMSEVQLLNLDASYNFLSSYYVLREIIRVNDNDPQKPFGFEFELYCSHEKIVRNFERVHSKILNW